MHNIVKDLYLGRRPNIGEFVFRLGEIFPYLKRFKDTPQDPIWHAEGNVHIHTGMVLDEMYKLIDINSQLSDDDRVSLILGALLHDIAKPVTTYSGYSDREYRDCIKASKHEIVGRDYLTHRLLDLGLSEKVYLDVISLVGYHQEPKMLVVKNKDRAAYIKHMEKVNWRLAYLLEVADMKGRISDDLEKQLQYLDDYAMFCEEYELKSRDDSYEHIVGTYLISQNELHSLDEAPAKFWGNKDRSRVTVMCGLPGAGKSNWIPAGSVVVSLDEIRKEINDKNYKRADEVIRISNERMKKYLAAGVDFIYDATNYRADFRKRIFDVCHAYKAIVEVKMILKPIKKCLSDNDTRGIPVGEDYIMKQVDRFQFPEYGEYHKLSIHIVK